MVEALIGCVTGAVLVSETEKMAKQAGLTEVKLETSSSYIEVMSRTEDALYQQILEALPKGAKAGDYINSLAVTAKNFCSR